MIIFSYIRRFYWPCSILLAMWFCVIAHFWLHQIFVSLDVVVARIVIKILMRALRWRKRISLFCLWRFLWHTTQIVYNLNIICLWNRLTVWLSICSWIYNFLYIYFMFEMYFAWQCTIRDLVLSPIQWFCETKNTQPIWMLSFLCFSSLALLVIFFFDLKWIYSVFSQLLWNWHGNFSWYVVRHIHRFSFLFIFLQLACAERGRGAWLFLRRD